MYVQKTKFTKNNASQIPLKSPIVYRMMQKFAGKGFGELLKIY